MEKNRTIRIDTSPTGAEPNFREATVMCGIDVSGTNYAVYTIPRNENEDNLFVAKLIKDNDGTDKLVNIDEQSEKDRLYKIVTEMVRYSVNSESDKATAEITLPSGEKVNLVGVNINKDQKVDTNKTYLVTTKATASKVSHDFYGDAAPIIESVLNDSVVATEAPVVPAAPVAEPAPAVEPIIPEAPVAPAAEPAPEVEPIIPEAPVAPAAEPAPAVEPMIPEAPVAPVAEPAPAVEPIIPEAPVAPAAEPAPAVEPIIPEAPVAPAAEPAPAVEPIIPEAPVAPAAEPAPVVEPIIPEAPVAPAAEPAPAVEPIIPEAPAAPVAESTGVVFNASAESNLNAALHEVAVPDIESIREFGVDAPAAGTTPEPAAENTSVQKVEGPVLTKKAGFANSKFFMVIAITFFLASCVFLGYEVFRYFKIVG